MTQFQKALWLVFWPKKLPAEYESINRAGMLGWGITFAIAYLSYPYHQHYLIVVVASIIGYYTARSAVVWLYLYSRNTADVLMRFALIAAASLFGAGFIFLVYFTVSTGNPVYLSIVFLVVACVTGAWGTSRYAAVLAVVDFLLAIGCLIIIDKAHANAVPAVAMVFCLLASMVLAKRWMDTLKLPNEVLGK